MKPEKETTEQKLKELVGKAVLICAPHIWQNHTGEIIAVEFTAVGWRLVVELSDGQRCGVGKPEQVKFLGDKRKTKNHPKNRRPGPGWAKYKYAPVWEHESGLRVHSRGICQLPDGKVIDGNEVDGGGLYRAIQEQGGNRRRGLMVWGLLQLPTPKVV